MSDPKNPEGPKSPSAPEVEAARAAWEKSHHGDSKSPADEGDSEPEESLDTAPFEDDDGAAGYVAPRKRAAFPPSFLLFAAAGCAILALEPTSDLGYALFGPSQPVDLGTPGTYDLDAAHDGTFAKIAGFATPRRGTYDKLGESFEVFVLAGTAFLVRRPAGPPPPPDVAELYSGEGRLLKLEEHPASFFERLVRPAARFTNVRLQFAAYGEIPSGRTAWLLVQDEVPRKHLGPILLPIGLWLLTIFLVYQAIRAIRLRHAR